MTETDFAIGDTVEWDSPHSTFGNFSWAGTTEKGIIGAFDDKLVVIDLPNGKTSILTGPWREALRKVDG